MFAGSASPFVRRQGRQHRERAAAELSRVWRAKLGFGDIHVDAPVDDEGEFICTVTFRANPSHNLTRSP